MHMTTIFDGMDNMSLGPVADHLSKRWPQGDFELSVQRLMHAMGVGPAHEFLMAFRDLRRAADHNRTLDAARDAVAHAFSCRKKGRSPWE